MVAEKILLCLLAVAAARGSAFGQRQGTFVHLGDAAGDPAATVSTVGADWEEEEGEGAPTTATNAKTGQVIEGRRVCLGVGGAAISCRRLFVITFSTRSASASAGYAGFGPGNCYYLASAAAHGLRPFVLGWQQQYRGHIMRLDAYIAFLRDFALGRGDAVLFTDGRDALFRCGAPRVLRRFDAAVAKQTRRAAAAGRPAGPLMWGADATCVPGFCAYSRRDLYPEGAVALPAEGQPEGGGGRGADAADAADSMRYLNAGAWMGDAVYARRYFEAMRAHCGWRAKSAAEPDECVAEGDGGGGDGGGGGDDAASPPARCVGDMWCAAKNGNTDNDQGIVSEAFVDAVNGSTFAYPALIDTDLDVLLTGWNCPLGAALASEACVVHLNGGFNLGWMKDKEREAQDMHRQAFRYAHGAGDGAGFGAGREAVRPDLLRMTLGLEGEAQPLRFADICDRCLPPPRSLTQKMMKRACGEPEVLRAVAGA
jgi:hypothetical protein